MFNLDDIANENNKEYDLKSLYIPDYPYRMLKIGGSGSGKTTGLLNLITEHYSESLIDKIYLYAKDLKGTKIPVFDEKTWKCRNKTSKDSKAFIEYSQSMDSVYNNIDDYDPSRKIKILIVFDDMIVNIMTNSKFQTTIKELFIRFRKLNISLYHTILFFYSKISQSKFYTLLNNEDLQQKKAIKYCY